MGCRHLRVCLLFGLAKDGQVGVGTIRRRGHVWWGRGPDYTCAALGRGRYWVRGVDLTTHVAGSDFRDAENSLFPLERARGAPMIVMAACVCVCEWGRGWYRACGGSDLVVRLPVPRLIRQDLEPPCARVCVVCVYARAYVCRYAHGYADRTAISLPAAAHSRVSSESHPVITSESASSNRQNSPEAPSVAPALRRAGGRSGSRFNDV